MFFDGVFTTKRKVDLKGNSRKDQDKHAFLEKQKHEREKRLLDKQRLKGTLLIQAFYRGRSSVAKTKYAERVSYDLNIKTITVDANAFVIANFVRVLLYFYEEIDEGRLRTLCMIILANILKGPTISYLGLCADINWRKQWLYQVKNLLKLCQQHLQSGDACYLKMLKFFTNLPILEVITGHEEAIKISDTVFKFLEEKGLFEITRACIASPSKTTDDKAAVLLLSLQHFNNSLPIPPEKTVAALLFTVFSAPGVMDVAERKELANNVEYFLTAVQSAPRLLEYIESCTSAVDRCLSLAANLIDSSSSVFVGHEEQLIKLENILLSVLPKRKQNVDGEEPDELPSPPANLTRLYNCLYKFASPATLKRMFDSVLPNQGAQKRGPLDLPPPSSLPPVPLHSPSSPQPFSFISSVALSALCHFAGTITSRSLFPSRVAPASYSYTLINAISTGSSFVRTAWAILGNSCEFAELEANGIAPHYTSILSITPFPSLSPSSTSTGSSISSAPTLKPTDFEATMGLWARSYSQILLTLDDQEFFEEQAYFRLDELRYMTSVMNRVVFRSYWSPRTSPHTGSCVVPIEEGPHDLRAVLTVLLRQLYDRDTRRPYCQSRHWLIDVNATRDNVHPDSLPTEKISTLLNNIPFVIPFVERVKIFHQYVSQDKETVRQDYYSEPHVTVRRNFIFEDGLRVFNMLGHNGPADYAGKLKQRIRVEFLNAEGLKEAGVDGGGLFKDFITDLVKTVFDPQYAFFLPTQDRKLYPNPSSSFISSEHIQQYEFLGRIVGKAMYESILVELPLANFFLSKIIGKHNMVNDLIFLDPQLQKNLIMLKTYDNVEDLALNFTVVDNEFGQAQVRELIPGGKDVAVTNENKIRYIYLVAHHRLNVQIKQQCDGFLRGFSELINPAWIQMFNQDELQFLISGSPGGIDVDDFRLNTVYSGGYSSNHPTIHMFWQVISEMTPLQQRDLLKFVTSCSRPPLLGFGYLYPRFCIHVSRAEVEDMDNYLPSASTCMNLLKLPQYSNKLVLSEKLLYAIASNAGFDLS